MSLNVKINEAKKVIDKQLNLRAQISLSNLNLPTEFIITEEEPTDHSNYILLNNFDEAKKVVESLGGQLKSESESTFNDNVYLTIWVIFPS